MGGAPTSCPMLLFSLLNFTMVAPRGNMSNRVWSVFVVVGVIVATEHGITAVHYLEGCVCIIDPTVCAICIACIIYSEFVS